jgi:hypothetical protein
MKKLVIFIIIYAIIALLVFSTKTNNIKEKMTGYASVIDTVLTTDYVNIGCYNDNITFSNYNTYWLFVGSYNNIDKLYDSNSVLININLIKHVAKMFTDNNIDLDQQSNHYNLDIKNLLYDMDRYRLSNYLQNYLQNTQQQPNKLILNQHDTQDSYNKPYSYLNSLTQKLNINRRKIPNEQSTVQNVSEALQKAVENKSPIFGLQNNNKLYFGSDLKRAIELGKNTNCLNSSTSLYNNIWVNKTLLSDIDKNLFDVVQYILNPSSISILITDYINVGCYIDNANRMIPLKQSSITNITEAKQLALNAKIPIFGLQNGGELYFGINLKNAIILGKDENCLNSDGLGANLSNSIWVNRKLLSETDNNLFDSYTPVLSDYTYLGCYYDNTTNRAFEMVRTKNSEVSISALSQGMSNAIKITPNYKGITQDIINKATQFAIDNKYKVFGISSNGYLFLGNNIESATQYNQISTATCPQYAIKPQNSIWKLSDNAEQLINDAARRLL